MEAWLVGGIPYGTVFIDETKANIYAEATTQKINKMKLWLVPDVHIFVGTELFFHPSPEEEKTPYIKIKSHKFNNVDGGYETRFEEGYGKYRMRLILPADKSTIENNISPLENYLKTLDINQINARWHKESAKKYVEETISNINRLLHLTPMILD